MRMIQRSNPRAGLRVDAASSRADALVAQRWSLRGGRLWRPRPRWAVVSSDPRQMLSGVERASSSSAGPVPSPHPPDSRVGLAASRPAAPQLKEISHAVDRSANFARRKFCGCWSLWAGLATS